MLPPLTSSTPEALPTAGGTASAAPRSRPQARRKPNEDAAYFVPVVNAGAKRSVPQGEGDSRVKRRRADPPSASISVSANARRSEKEKMVVDSISRATTMDMTMIPIAAIHRYLSQYDLVPTVAPSPLSASDPPTPSSLLNPYRHNSRPHSPPAPVTPANRPRREKEQNRRRSSRLLEEGILRTPILADIGEVSSVLASIAERHFQQHSVKDVDTLATFISICKVAKALA